MNNSCFLFVVYFKLQRRLKKVIQSWLFRSDGRLNLALGRVAIGVALLLTITHNKNFTFMVFDWDIWKAGVQSAGWSPKGVIKVFDYIYSGVPPIELTKTIYIAALTATVLMIAGLFTFPAQIIATTASVYIVSLQTSYGPYWSHAYNVQLLAALVFMFSRRSADVFSIDAAVRRFFKLPAHNFQGTYWWPVIFAELSTAAFMFGAFFQKFRDTGFYWAVSDNLRNSVTVTWFQYRSDPPEIALWIASDPLIWKTAGLLQLFAQATTILAAFLVNRPVFRLVFGGVFFFLEILGLGHVFRFWHIFWIPLCFLSVDWEHFISRFKGAPIVLPSWGKNRFFYLLRILFQRRTSHKCTMHNSELPTVYPFVLIYGVMFFGYYGATLIYRLGETHLNYPFSTMGFYSETRAKPPYNKHTFYPIYTGRIDAYEEGSYEPIALWYREGFLEDMLFRVNSINALRKIDESYSLRAQRGLYRMPSINSSAKYELKPVNPIRVIYRAGLMAVPPYPEAPKMVDFHMGYRAVRDHNGFRALIAKTQHDDIRGLSYVTLEHVGFKKPKFSILINPGGRSLQSITQPVTMSGYWEDSRFYITQSFDKEFILVHVEDSILDISEIYYGADVF